MPRRVQSEEHQVSQRWGHGLNLKLQNLVKLRRCSESPLNPSQTTELEIKSRSEERNKISLQTATCRKSPSRSRGDRVPGKLQGPPSCLCSPKRQHPKHTPAGCFMLRRNVFKPCMHRANHLNTQICTHTYIRTYIHTYIRTCVIYMIFLPPSIQLGTVYKCIRAHIYIIYTQVSVNLHICIYINLYFCPYVPYFSRSLHYLCWNMSYVS